MAIFILGMSCAISGRQIESASQAIAFPAFVSNEADPLLIFNDAVVHAEEFALHPLASRAISRLEEFRSQTTPSARACLHCKRPITNPDDYIGFGHITDARNVRLHSLNYCHLHRTCVAAWSMRGQALADLELLEKSGDWKGNGLRELISVLRI